MNTTTTPKTPVLSATDNRGLPVRVLQYNIDAAGTPCCLVTHTLANDASHIMQHRDPRRFTAWVRDSTEAPNLTSIPSLTGQVLRRDSTDSGWQVTLYDAEGRPAWMTDGRGTVNRVDYDILGRPLTRYTRSAGNSADQASARYVYGDADTQTSVPQGNNLRGICVRKYDEGGRLSVDQVALSGALLSQGQTFLRSAEGQPDWQGQESDWAALLEVGNNVVQTTTVTANAQGAALSQTDAAGHSLFWAYDVAGSVSNQSLTLSGQSPQVLLTSLSYSAAGQPLAEVAGNDVTTTYVYEPQTQRLSNISAVRRGDSITLQNLSYIYDPVGNIINITDGTVGIRYFRNQATDGIRIFTYDALYQLVSATGRENAGAGTQNGALPAITPLPEGDTAYSPYTRNYTYDGSGNLITLSHIGDNCYSQTMVTDTFSNRSVQQDSSDSLAPDDVGSYFDVSGNLQQLHAQTLPATDDNYGLVWDTDNQLQTAILVNRNQGSDSSQSDRELYQYRDGMRVRKQTRTLTNTDTGLWTVSEVRYLPGLEMRNTWQETVTEGGISSPTYSEQLEVATTQAGRSQIRVLHWVLGQPTDVERDQVRYSVDDQVGSLVLELDSTGQLISREEYYPYGGTAVWSSRNQTEASYKTVRYSGKERDGTGLCYYGYRYYAPWLCRWLNADPAGEVDGLNLFRMCRNNPVNLNDPNGKYSVHDVVITAVKKVDSYLTKKLSNYLVKRGVSQSGIRRWNQVRRTLMLGVTVGTFLAGIVAGAGVSLAVIGGVLAAGFVIGGAIGWFANKISDKFAGWMARRADGKSTAAQALAGAAVAAQAAFIHNASSQGDVVAAVVGAGSGTLGAIFDNTPAGMAGANAAGTAVGTVDTLSGGQARLPTQGGAALGGAIAGWVLGTPEGSSDVGEAAGIGAYKYGNKGRQLDVWVSRQYLAAVPSFALNIVLPVLSPRLSRIASALQDVIPEPIAKKITSLLAKRTAGGHMEFAGAVLGGTTSGTYRAIDIRTGGEATRLTEAVNTAWETTTFERFKTAFVHYFQGARNETSYA
jgi:insecticidal toxin complex protein TccC